MKKYASKEELIKDLESNLKDDNPFDKYILDRLGNPPSLVEEYKKYPYLRLVGKDGWFFVWKNKVIEINKEWVRVEDLLNRLRELLDESK